MSRLILEPGNPHDFEAHELEELAAELHAQTRKGVDVALRAERGYGGPLHEVLHVWIPWKALEGAAAAQVVNLLVSWLKKRWKKDDAQHPGQARPRSLLVWTTNGRCSSVIVVDYGEDGEPAVATKEPEDSDKRPRPQRQGR
jgi:hypothetical protein